MAGLEGGAGSAYSNIDIFGFARCHLGQNCTGRRIDTVEHLSGDRIDEFAANECLAAEPQVGGAGFPVFMGKVMHVSVHFHLHSWVRTVSGIQKFVALWVFGNLDDRLAQDSSATRRRI
ncbi:MAG: hypothetical protein V9G14_15255 [Cypionkella sp.]